ncbi:endo-1,4-beta xylanase [Cyathus striatus]|nr:endo-1,4-beta xylanase [Cyathus striatus]
MLKEIFLSSAMALAFVPTSYAQLDILAQLAGKKYFGTATDNPELTNTSYVAQLGNTLDFHQLTPANSMKWENTEPERGVFTFAGGDQIVQQAQKHNQLMRGHNCVWHNQLASWVTDGNFDNATLLSIVENHCGTLVGHYKGQIVSWDVLNEIFNDDGTFRQSVFFNTTGTAYIATALRAARKADPKAKLYINDFNIEGSGAKSTALANLVKQLKADKVPIDGIGVQSHMIVGEIPSTMKDNLQMFADLGVEVAITELDVRMTLPETPALLEQQKKDYTTIIQACKEVKGCIGVTVWDWTDKFSWVPGTFAGQGAACPWDENFKKKPAYLGIVEGWLGL